MRKSDLVYRRFNLSKKKKDRKIRQNRCWEKVFAQKSQLKNTFSVFISVVAYYLLIASTCNYFMRFSTKFKFIWSISSIFFLVFLYIFTEKLSLYSLNPFEPNKQHWKLHFNGFLFSGKNRCSQKHSVKVAVLTMHSILIS